MTETLVQDLLKELAHLTALGAECMAVLIIGYGALEAFARTLAPLFGRPATDGWRKRIWIHFGMWLLLGLQFALAADIVHSAIAPTWNDIGQLAAIALIRTFLNYFLERDIESTATPEPIQRT